MIRTNVGILILIAAVLWLPAWIQVCLFGIGILVLSYRILVLVPALISDAIYAPVHSIVYARMTLIVLGMLGLWYIVTTYTRIGQIYDTKKK